MADIITRNLQRAGITDPAFAAFVQQGLHAVEAGGRELTADGKLIEGPNTKYGKARGPLQIIKGTFDDVAKSSGQALDWSNNDDLTYAGILYAKRLWDMTGGDPYRTARAYQGGPGILNRSDQISDGNLTNREYAQRVVANIQGGQALQTAMPPAVAGNAAPTDITPVAAAIMEQQARAPAGELVAAQQQVTRPQAPTELPWDQALRALQSAEQAAPQVQTDDALDLLAEFEQLDRQASALQDQQLARALGGGQTPGADRGLQLPAAVDRYLDRVLS